MESFPILPSSVEEDSSVAEPVCSLPFEPVAAVSVTAAFELLVSDEATSVPEADSGDDVSFAPPPQAVRIAAKPSITVNVFIV
ncbi:hypothetical protein D3C76_1379230 [compost metagenome]